MRWTTYADGRNVQLAGDADCWHNPNNYKGKAMAKPHSFCPVGRR